MSAEEQLGFEEMRRDRKVVNVFGPLGVTQVLTINVNTHGYGDAITAAWIAEGANTSSRRLRLCASGDKAELLRMLGQEVIEPNGGCASYDRAGPEYGSSLGNPPLAVFRAQRLGISDFPARPTVTIPQDAVTWAQDHHVQVLLCPQCTQVSRTWPHEHWVALYDSLKRDGKTVIVSGIPDSHWNFCRDWMPSLSWPRQAALMRKSLVIGNDSAPMHLAGTLNRPAIAILGRTTDAMFAIYPSVRCLSADRRTVLCAGCWSGWGYEPNICERRCAALDSISVNTVLDRATDILSPKTHTDIGIAVACWGTYWSLFGETFVGSMECMNPRPNDVVVVTREPIDAPDWIRRVEPRSPLPMWDWFNEAVQACRSEWVIVPGVDDVYFPNALDNLALAGDAVGMGLRENGVIHALSGLDHWRTEILLDNATPMWYSPIFKREVFMRFPWRRVVNPDSIQLLEMRKAGIDMRFDPRPRFDHRRHRGAHSAQESLSSAGQEQVRHMKRLLNAGHVAPGCEWPPQISRVP